MNADALSFIGLGTFVVCQLGVLSHDLLYFRIPNIFPFMLILIFTLLALVNDSFFPFINLDIKNHLICGGVVLVLGFAMFSLGIIGGGDAKLAAATALWFGWPLTLDYLIYSSLIGAVIAVIMVTFKLSVYGGGQPDGHGKAKFIPFGVALGIGSLYVATYTPLFRGGVSFVSSFF